MKIKIINRSLTRREMIRSAVRWALYALLLMIFYSIQCTMPFFKWQPLLIIDLAVCVAFFEGELSGCIFAAICGMMHDLSLASLFGFTSIWLIPCCLFVTLFVTNLIHKNILNYIWMNAVTIIIIELTELLFKYVIWRNPHIGIIVLEYMLPASLSAVALSVPIYLLVRFIKHKLGDETADSGISAAMEQEDDKKEQIRF